MKQLLVILLFELCATTCAAMSSNSVVAVTNDWRQGNFSNVLSLAQFRYSNNTNDVVAAYLLLNYDMAFSYSEQISNSIDRVIGTSRLVTNIEFRAFSDRIEPSWRKYQRERLARFTSNEWLERDLKARRANHYMPSEYALHLLQALGLW